MIRPANAVDVPDLIALLQEGYRRSIYADVGNIAEKAATQLLLGMILKHGIPAIDGTHCMVIERDGKIVGLHFGAKQRVYMIGSKYFASDAFFYVQPGHPFEVIGLVDSFISWAAADPRVIEILPGVTDVISDYHAAGQIYEKMGFVQSGAIYRHETRSAA